MDSRARRKAPGKPRGRSSRSVPSSSLRDGGNLSCDVRCRPPARQRGLPQSRRYRRLHRMRHHRTQQHASFVQYCSRGAQETTRSGSTSRASPRITSCSEYRGGPNWTRSGYSSVMVELSSWCGVLEGSRGKSTLVKDEDGLGEWSECSAYTYQSSVGRAVDRGEAAGSFTPRDG